MTYFDNEFGAAAQSVTNYYFEDDESEPICFSVLPIKWSESEMPAYTNTRVFLGGITDSGSERIYKRVISWKIEFAYEQPNVSVLSQEKRWIRIQKPRKSFEDTIRTVLITIHCLHFLKRNPETSESTLWSHLQNIFGLLKGKPSQHDLLRHLPLIRSAVKRDKIFSKSEDFDHEKVVKKTILTTEIDEEYHRETLTTSGDEPDQVWDLCDDVCALCDNGGELLCCEGRCLRSFHGTVHTGFVSGCKSLSLSEDQVKEKSFFCENCQYKQHQCFACGKLGSSDTSRNPEVFRCSSMTCGHFYHPECVATLLHPINYSAAKEVERNIIAGHSFICTVHRCSVCKKEEDKNDVDMQFAICRRCPKVFHRKCLPREIRTESLLDEGILQRAWNDLLPDRILIYCLKHKIDSHTLTPERNHIIFPNIQGKKKSCSPAVQPVKEKISTTKTSLDSGNHPRRDTAQVVKPPFPKKTYDGTKRHAKQASRERFGSKFHVIDTSKSHSKDRTSSISKKPNNLGSLDDVRNGSLNQIPNKGLEIGNSKRQGLPSIKPKTFVKQVPLTKKSTSPPSLVRTEAEACSRNHTSICEKVDMMKERPSPPDKPSSQAHSHNIVDEVISCERRDGSVEVAEASVQKLKESNFDDIKASYEPEFFDNLTKLKIADKLLCYAQTGDTIINFGCGDEEFSCLMQESLAEIRKKCHVRTYDVLQAEFDFDKEEDWPTASRLVNILLHKFIFIIGLIFPGGIGGVSVDEFIDKVLEQKLPKLLLLMCPRVTKRLDENNTGYNLIWEENISGTQQVVYLWSRHDWKACYNRIALAEGHISNQISSVCEDKSDVEDLNQEAVHFVQAPLISFLNGSCGWVDD
ncbi:hypothetical protein ACHQM5_025625 [Ranunculus cassubicifolius]